MLSYGLSMILPNLFLYFFDKVVNIFFIPKMEFSIFTLLEWLTISHNPYQSKKPIRSKIRLLLYKT